MSATTSPKASQDCALMWEPRSPVIAHHSRERIHRYFSISYPSRVCQNYNRYFIYEPEGEPRLRSYVGATLASDCPSLTRACQQIFKYTLPSLVVLFYVT